MSKSKCMILCLMNLCFLFAGTEVKAQEPGFLYGFERETVVDPETNDSRVVVSFGRFNPLTGEAETLAEDVTYPFSTNKAVIDRRRGHYCYVTSQRKLVRIDLTNGQLVSITDVQLQFADKLQNRNYFNLRYSYKADEFYTMYSYLDHPQADWPKVNFVKIDASDFSISESLWLNLGDYSFHDASLFFECGWTVDEDNGWLLVAGLVSSLLKRDIATLQPIGSVNIQGGDFRDIHYNVHDQKLYLFYLGLNSIDLVANRAETVEVKWDPSLGRAKPCGPGLDEIGRKFYRVFENGELALIDFGGNIVSIIAESEFRFSFNATAYNPMLTTRQLSGRVVADSNNDCIAGPEELPLLNRTVFFRPGNQQANTDENGRFVVNLLPGEYTVEFSDSDLWASACNDELLTITVTENAILDADGNPIDAVEYVLQADEEISRLNVDVLAGVPRPGFEQEYIIAYSNSGTVPFSGSVVFKPDNLLTDFSATTTPDLSAQDRYEWFVEDLPVGTRGRLVITMQLTPDEALLGQELCAEAFALDQNKEELSWETHAEACAVIVGSYDPNSISVTPRGIGESGAITISDSVLTYTVHFQNEGTASAVNVRVRCVLNANLDVEHLQFGAATHPYSVSALDERTIEFEFVDINLPHKELDEAASQGSVQFKVKLKQELQKGDEIRQIALIYFDFNSPIFTNVALNTIAEPTTHVSSELPAPKVNLLYRPDSNELQITSDGLLNGNVSIVSVRGLTVVQEEFIHARGQSLNLAGLSSGIYFVMFESNGIQKVESINIVR